MNAPNSTQPAAKITKNTQALIQRQLNARKSSSAPITASVITDCIASCASNYPACIARTLCYETAMRILFIGDIVGKPGRDVVGAELPRLIETLKLDFVIANGENAAGGFGLTRAIANEFFATAADCITPGNHWPDQKEILSFIGDEDRVLRPRNLPPGTPGKRAGLYQAKS